ncbi:MAG: SDR family NAD(P)-dependent oxidoreductase [Sphingomonadales bacterium]
MGIYEQFSLKHKVAVVTGAGRGIGRGIAIAFAEAGADVAVIARRQADLDEVVGVVESLGCRGLAIACDVTEGTAIPDALDRVVTTFGQLDIMVNNAGGNPDRKAVPVAETSLERWDDVLSLNMRHKFWGASNAARRMLDGGRIINVVSRAAYAPTPGFAAYAAGNAGIISMSVTMAIELAPRGITVNCIAPGAVYTDLVKGSRPGTAEEMQASTTLAAPLGRLGKPEDIAAAALYLASPAAEWITGQCIRVSGGR